MYMVHKLNNSVAKVVNRGERENDKCSKDLIKIFNSPLRARGK
jgi:hypothetical protein